MTMTTSSSSSVKPRWRTALAGRRVAHNMIVPCCCIEINLLYTLMHSSLSKRALMRANDMARILLFRSVRRRIFILRKGNNSIDFSPCESGISRTAQAENSSMIKNAKDPFLWKAGTNLPVARPSCEKIAVVNSK